ncbi:MAG: germination protein YpeB [Clostridia bacterium]|nr:germination protein YpeB [Clostridia bacterium]
MKKRTFIRVVSFLSAIIIAAFGLFISERSKNRQYRRIIENSYAGAFDELSSSLNDISTNLIKISYVTTPKQMAIYASEIYSQAQLAKGALYKLPTGENELSTVYKFLSQVGNYTLSVSKDVISGNDVTDKQRSELKGLSSAAKTITDAIEQSDLDYNNSDYWASAIESKLKGALDQNGLGSALAELENSLSDYPTLIYDGPYSDHILNKTPLMIENAGEITETAAHKVAQTVTGENGISFSDMQSGIIECYRFSNGETNVTVSKKGGYPVYMRKTRTVGESKYSYGMMIAKASDYLKQNGFENMIDTYYFTDGGVCVINFAYLDGQTVCYTDLIKVGVAADTGEIMLLETAGYLTNHTSRAFEGLVNTAEQACAALSPELTVEKTSVCLIPTSGGGEIRCFEFTCKNEDGADICVYINVKTLEVEQILILLKTDGGTLVK